MEPIDCADLPADALLLIDSAPIIYVLEDHAAWASRYAPIFTAAENGHLRLAVTTLSVAEVLGGPVAAGQDALAKRYRRILESWQCVVLTTDIAEAAARLRVTAGLKLADAVQVASALAIDAVALVTADRDFSRVRSIRIIR